MTRPATPAPRSASPAAAATAAGALALTLLALAACDTGSLGPGGGGHPDGGSSPGPDLGDLGAVPDGAGGDGWQWLDVPGSVCGNGQPTGLGWNAAAGATDLVVFIEGGGACWEANACFGIPLAATIPANLLTGYGAAAFAREPLRAQALFDRHEPRNPLAAASFAFVPYCTGDLHAGDHVQHYEPFLQAPADIHHRGGHNMGLFADALAARFAGVKRVLLVGVSAGGYGAQFNYHRFVGAFPGAEVHLLADCSQLVQPTGGLPGSMKAAWSTIAPPGCAGCDTDFPALADFLPRTNPARRFGLLAFDHDAVLELYFGYPLLDDTFATATRALLAKAYDPHPNARYFLRAGNEHTMLGSLTTASGPGGVAVADWVGWWASGDPRWTSLK